MSSNLDKYKDPRFNNEINEISNFLRENLVISVDILDGYLHIDLRLKNEDFPFSTSSIYLRGQSND